ncbi:hypothetical protein [Staphylococcus caeli]|uniref:Uncharacterized protein n=1 Tax=Staphylococcus caeli TaxID=2201815 RepID=A0A1D4NNY1_9STAP|nr:hypothetical protein [Staphylococcus caeli]SCT12369.1 Uncharacterised protein [Staphylococcus caeli]SCT50990.1 Uncharacterised protein [Staphylococcus caeli]
MNIQLENLKINFQNEAPAPFFQVEDNHRIRLDIEYINRENLTQIVDMLFKDNSCIKLSYYYGTVFPNLIKEPTRIGRYISIKNWKEELIEIENEYNEKEAYVIVTITNIRKSELINYILYLKNAVKNPYMCVYDKHNLLCNSTDVIDIVSGSTSIMNDLKSVYNSIENHFYSEE